MTLKMLKSFAGLLVALAVVGLAACGADGPPPASPTSTATPTPPPPTETATVAPSPSPFSAPASPTPSPVPPTPTPVPTAVATATTAPVAPPTPAPPPPPATRHCRFGVVIWPQSEISNQIDQAAEAGACWTRINLFWDRIEPQKTSPRSYNWAQTDEALLSANRAGIAPILLISANPQWAAPFPGGPANNPQDLLDFVTAAAERYDGDGLADAPGSPVAQVWELYNEPDNRSEEYARYRNWGYWGERGAEYAQLAAQVRQALKAANPNAELALGGLAHEKLGRNTFDMNFPRAIFEYIRAHPGDYFDYFNFHYFPPFGPRYGAWGPDILGKTNYFRAMMAEYGLEWPIIVTEAGLWSGGGAREPWVGNHQGQSGYVVQLYSRSVAADLSAVLWLLMFDHPDEQWQRGLSHSDGQPKPAFNAYRTMVDKLDTLRLERPLSADELGTPYAEGYLFVEVGSARRVYVAWTTTLDAPGRLRVDAPAVLVSDKLSSQLAMEPPLPVFNPYTLSDEADGAHDGVTLVPFHSSPVYVEVLP